jgi:hypothetical protein
VGTLMGAQIIRLPSGREALDTGKVRIGIRAPAPQRDMGTQAELIQSALLNPHVKGAAGAMDLRRLADAPTLRARAMYDDAHTPVVYLDNSIRARLMRAFDRLLMRMVMR